jgi:ArsR family transcriptional regulator
MMELTQQHAEMCAALADPCRLLILYALEEKPYNVSELALRLGVVQPTVSRHLRVLRESSMVSAQRRGKAVYYAPADPRIIQALDLLRSVLTDMLRDQGEQASQAAVRPTIERNHEGSR